jgi:hypothetical protein
VCADVENALCLQVARRSCVREAEGHVETYSNFLVLVSIRHVFSLHKRDERNRRIKKRSVTCVINMRRMSAFRSVIGSYLFMEVFSSE